MSDSVLSPEYDYKPAMYRHGSKIFTRIVQQTGGSTLTGGIPVTSSAYSDFEIPIRAMYLSDSYIRGKATPTVPGAGGRFNWFRRDMHFVSEVHLMTRSGQYLVQLFNADKYRALTRGWQVPFQDFMTADPLDRFGPSRDTGATANLGGRVAGAAQADAPYTEVRYVERGGDNLNTAIPFTIRLGEFRNTLLGLKKAMLFPELVILRVVWGPMQRFGWYSTNATAPATGEAALAGAVAIDDLYLHLAIENDPDIVRELLSLQASKYQMAIPWVHVNKQAITAGTSIATTVKATPDMGFMLKQIIYGMFHTTETESLAQDHDNREGAKVVSYQTSLDGVTRQQYLLNCATPYYDDWKHNERLCKGTAIQSRDIYQYNWFHCDDFSDLSERKLDELKGVARDNVYSGISIQGPQGSDRTWTISGTRANAAFNQYTFMITYKTMIITPTGVQVVNVPPGVASA